MPAQHFTRRTFLRSAGALLAIRATNSRVLSQRKDRYDITEKTISQLQAAVSSGETTCADIVSQYINRITAYDQSGPRLNAVIRVNGNALIEARALDAERKTRRARGPLHGIPVLLKDNFDTNGMRTTGGSVALSNNVPTADAFQVRKLRQAGVVILGKVNLHELALGLTTFSSLKGQTLNPYDVSRAPGGSSGGSGVAAAACFAAFTMGTDTSGSIRIPSSHNSIVGLRPSAGLSSRAGIIPFGHTQDTGGPMARTVEDIAIVLDATVGYDPADPITANSKGKIPRTYTSSLKPGALKGARIGVLNEFFGTAPEDEEVGSIVRRAIDDMKMQGATAVDVTVPNLAQQLMASNLLVQELKFYLRDYLKHAGAPVTSVEELLASGLHAAQLQGFLENANAVPDDYLSGDDYKSRLSARAVLGQSIVNVMDAARLDAIVYPTARRIAPLIGGNQIGSNAGLSAQTGFPAITVPAGFTTGGFPVGIEMLGRLFAEPTLLGLAYAYERSTRHRRLPALTPPLTKTFVNNIGVVVPPFLGIGNVRFEVTATGAQSIPPSDVPIQVVARFSFNNETRQLGYEVMRPVPTEEIAGIYLHRRVERANGGVSFILGNAGSITLTQPEVTDLRAGKFYVSAISAKDPRRSARANLVLP